MIPIGGRQASRRTFKLANDALQLRIVLDSGEAFEELCTEKTLLHTLDVLKNGYLRRDRSGVRCWYPYHRVAKVTITETPTS